MDRPTVYEVAGGEDAFLRLAAAHHARCVVHPVLEHPFSHGTRPDHVERLAAYWAEVFGGPEASAHGGVHQTPMLRLHAESGAEDDLGPAFLECFLAAVDDAGLPADADLRRALHDYMAWAVADVMQYAAPGSTVPRHQHVPRWGWDGPEPAAPT